MAVINDKPIKGGVDDYGSGWYNTDRKKGTLVWDGKLKRLSVQVLEDAHDIVVSDRGNFWAQGGVSMSLQDEQGWARQAELEDMPAMDEPRMRSGMVYDASGSIWLIVSPTPCTVEQFRTAVKEQIGAGKLVDGIFLDGDGSSQMKCAGVALAGDGRQVYQMIALLH